MKELQSIFTRVEERTKYNTQIQKPMIPTINVYEQCVNFIANDKLTDDDIVDNKELRDKVIRDGDNLQLGMEALTKVGNLFLYPNGYANTNMVIKYFGVDENTLKSAINRNIIELTENGLIKLESKEDMAKYRKYVKELNLSLEDSVSRESNKDEFCKLHLETDKYEEINPKGRSAHLFNRRVILNIAMLLRDNPVAKEIRKFILDITETSHFKDLIIVELTNIIKSYGPAIQNVMQEIADLKTKVDKNTEDLDITQDAVLNIASNSNMI